MKNIAEVLKKNWMTLALLLVIGYLLLPKTQIRTGLDMALPVTGGGVTGKIASVGIVPPVFPEAAPVAREERLVVTNTNLSLKVNDVRKAIDEIVAQAEKLGGFLVDSSLSVPDGPATGVVSVRIPSDKLAEGLTAIRALGVKVISENVVGTDVTSEYVDIEARLSTLLKTKEKFEQILAGATRVEDLLNIQRELINLQAQIDSLRGQQKYLEQTAKLSLVTVYLATDELALPYTPDEAWRPTVIFREAVRSLIRSVRGLGTGVIWAVVYAPIWLPILGLVWWLRRKAR